MYFQDVPLFVPAHCIPLYFIYFNLGNFGTSEQREKAQQMETMANPSHGKRFELLSPEMARRKSISFFRTPPNSWISKNVLSRSMEHHRMG